MSSESATHLRAFQSRATELPLGFVPAFGLGILLVAIFFPASPPTALAFTDPHYSNIWSTRIYGAGNSFEIAMGLFALAWIVNELPKPTRLTRFDRPLLILVCCLAAIEAVSLFRTLDDAIYLKPDLETIAMLVAGYAIVTRCVQNMQVLRVFTYAVAAVICLRAIELVFAYGLTGQTYFTTILGRQALLITEDGLLLTLPVVLAWGALLDRALPRWGRVGAIVGTTLAFVVNLLSLRRGAVLLLSAAVFARSLTVGWNRILQGTGVAILIATIAVIAGPGRSVLDQAQYTVESSLLRTGDASSSQRGAELQDFGRNINGFDWMTGRGIGVLWRAETPAPLDAASFGSKENQLIRLGWHVYGLDWAYKFGLLGIALICGVGVLLGKMALGAYRASNRPDRRLIYSIGVCVPGFALMSLTNPRIALVAGVLLGLLSRCCDFAPDRLREGAVIPEGQRRGIDEPPPIAGAVAGAGAG